MEDGTRCLLTRDQQIQLVRWTSSWGGGSRQSGQSRLFQVELFLEWWEKRMDVWNEQRHTFCGPSLCCHVGVILQCPCGLDDDTCGCSWSRLAWHECWWSMGRHLMWEEVEFELECPTCHIQEFLQLAMARYYMTYSEFELCEFNGQLCNTLPPITPCSTSLPCLDGPSHGWCPSVVHQ